MSGRRRARSHSPWAAVRPTSLTAVYSWEKINGTRPSSSDTECRRPEFDSETTSAAAARSLAIENNNSNVNLVSGSANVANNNPSMYLAPGSSLHYAPVTNFNAAVPKPSVRGDRTA